jgi:hypothetical protein
MGMVQWWISNQKTKTKETLTKSEAWFQSLASQQYFSFPLASII